MTIKCNFKAPGQLCGKMKVKTGGGEGELCSLPAGKCDHQGIIQPMLVGDGRPVEPCEIIQKLDDYPNGEITFNPKTSQYRVWNETYTEAVCVTDYYKVAEAALTAYGKHYL